VAPIQFYHLTATPLERALPKLLEKAFAAGLRCVVVTGSAEKTEQLNQLLWTYDAASFLPHGAQADGMVEAQPIFLSPEMTLVNQPSAAFITDGSVVASSASFSRVLDLFDGHDTQATEAARARWVKYREMGHTLSYMQQSPQGGWQERKAEAA
jgi:DNA polymerase-3 subunit chi